MHITQSLNVNPVYNSTTPPTQAPKQAGSSQPTDTVQLSAAAKAHIAKSDADGDSDGH